MQDYTDFAEKNGVHLNQDGPCQFCLGEVTRGVHECVEIFSLGFEVLDFSQPENHLYRFLSVDAHTLQHPEIHGRWNNHFHLTRLHLILEHGVAWSYERSPQLSNSLKGYKANQPNEYLTPPPIGHRGAFTAYSVKKVSSSQESCQEAIEQWAKEVYHSWGAHHLTAERIAQLFLNR